jgi:uncharacterized protein affecting Mg2+/Co2+ transport
MKKSVISFAIVALMAATTLFAQTNVSGATTSTTPAETTVEAEYAGSIQDNGSKTFGFAISPDHSYANMMIGYRFGNESVPKQIILGAEAKEMFRVGSSPILLGLSVLGQARTNGSEFCVEYCDLGASVGFEVGQWYFGLTPKVNIKTPKGLKLQIDAEFAPADNAIIYAYGLALVNTSDDNKNFVVSGSKWIEGPDRYQEYAGGIGAWYQFSSGCFVSLDTGVFWTNNEFMTKDGKKTSLSWKTTAKTGGEKVALGASFELGGELDGDNKSQRKVTLFSQIKL